jgi:hypothetical protein
MGRYISWLMGRTHMLGGANLLKDHSTLALVQTKKKKSLQPIANLGPVQLYAI